MKNKNNNEIIITLEMPIPSINKYWKPRIIKGRFNGMYLTKEGKAYKEALNLTARTQIKEPIQDEIGLSIYFYVNRKNRDIDNMLKPVLDALEGILYINDRQINKLFVYKYISEIEHVTIKTVS
jgi:Holliday junction resolvase RusA-like endonuclease